MLTRRRTLRADVARAIAAVLSRCSGLETSEWRLVVDAVRAEGHRVRLHCHRLGSDVPTNLTLQVSIAQRSS